MHNILNAKSHLRKQVECKKCWLGSILFTSVHTTRTLANGVCVTLVIFDRLRASVTLRLRGTIQIRYTFLSSDVHGHWIGAVLSSGTLPTYFVKL